MNSKTLAQSIGGILISLGLGGCGGGGGGDPPPGPSGGQSTSITISGTAAAGAPLAGRVTIKDSLGAVKTVNLAANGTYSIDVSGMTPPFVLRAEGTTGGRSYVLHSGATAADRNGTINITPFTELIIANIARQVAANYFDSGNITNLTTSQLDTAENELQQRLQSVLTDLGVSASIDLVRTAFNANHQGLDAALDVLRVTVDKATNTATIVNVLNNAAITDDLTTNDTSIIDSTGTVSGLSDWDAILARFASLEAAFATGLPAANDPLLLAHFDQAGFLDWGRDLASLLADLTSDPGMVGFKFASITLVKLTPATAMANGSALVNLGFGDATYGYEYSDMYMTGIYSASGTNWVIAGNQYIADVGGEMQSILGFNRTDRTEIQSGINFFSDVGPAGSEIDYAVITGPGLPNTGGGANGNSAGLLMVRDSGSNMFVAFPPYNGPATLVHPRAQRTRTMYSWTDQEITALPSDNLVYTQSFYSDPNGTPSNFNDDIKLATYQFTMLKPPLPAGSLSAANFPVITSPSATDTLSVYATGGPLTVMWTLPQGLAAESLDAIRWYSGGSDDAIESDVSPMDTSATLQITPPTGTVTGGILDVAAADFYSRNYSYRRFMP